MEWLGKILRETLWKLSKIAKFSQFYTYSFTPTAQNTKSGIESILKLVNYSHIMVLIWLKQAI